MLHAVYKGNTLYHRYLGTREGDERKVHEEDEITSIVLGPLDFLPGIDVYRFWMKVLQSSGHAVFIPNAPPANVDVNLWTTRRSSKDGKPITPDGVVTIKTECGKTLILLLELKWRARLSGDDQLHRQWKYFLNKTEQSQALHLFIAPEISAGAQAPNNKEAGGDVWESEMGSRLVLLPWLKVRAVLAELGLEKNTPLGRWARLADKFLEKVGILKFSGFEHISTAISLPSLDSSHLFWMPYKFAGWKVCGNPPAIPSFAPLPFFFPRKYGK